MAYTTYDLATDIGKLRAITGDRVVDGAAHYTDADLQVFLDLEGGDIRLAAAMALESWAGEIAIGSYELRIGDYTEKPVGAAAMVSRAKALRESVNNTPAFAVADMLRWEPFVDYLLEEVR